MGSTNVFITKNFKNQKVGVALQQACLAEC